MIPKTMYKFRLILPGFFGLIVFCILFGFHIQTYLPTTFFNKVNIFVYNIIQNSPINSSTIPAPQEVSSSPFSFAYIIAAKEICQSSNNTKFLLMIVVCSAVKNTLERQTIRETWGSIAYNRRNEGNIRLAFLLGSNNDQNYTKLVLKESKSHHDIIHLDFVDSYRNLTYKSIALLKWITDNCPNVQYVLKSDDDMFVNVPNLVREIEDMKTKKNVMFGVLIRRAHPIRDVSSKWFVSETEYPGNGYPDFLSGTAYAMSRDVIPKLYEASFNQSFLYLEDVFVTGLCAKQAKVKRRNSPGFTLGKRPSNGCAYLRYITGHRVTVPEMRKIYSELQDPNNICDPFLKVLKRSHKFTQS